MSKFKFSLNTKVEVAIEVIAAKIAEASKNGLSAEEMSLLLNERDGVYNGNVKVINKIIEIYGPEIKEKLKGV